MATQGSKYRKGPMRAIPGKHRRTARGKLVAAIESLEPRQLLTGAPTSLGVAEDSSGYADLSWTAPSGSIDNYQALSSPDGSTFTPITSSISGSATTYSVVSPTIGSPEYFEIIAIAGGVSSSPSNVVTSATTGSRTAMSPALPSPCPPARPSF